MNISREICDSIQQHKEIQVKVQKYASELSAYNEIIQGKKTMILEISFINTAKTVLENGSIQFLRGSN